MADTATASTTPNGNGNGIERGESLWNQSFRRFKNNKMAVFSLVFLIVLVLMAIFAPLVTTHTYFDTDLVARDQSPNERFLLGSDYLGRDVYTRVIYGARVSLAVAFVGSFISFLVGLVYGVTSGYLGGKADSWMMRVVDVLYGLPTLILVILIMVYFRAGQPEKFTGFKLFFYNLDSSMGGMLFIFLGIGITSWLQMARIARGETLAIKNREFVENATAQGISHSRIIFKHLLPNILGPCIVLETASIPSYILTEAFLSFIGLGVNPPMPSWGSMIQEGYQAIRSYPHEIMAPVVLLTLTVLAFNFFGDGLRDALDPKVVDK